MPSNYVIHLNKMDSPNIIYFASSTDTTKLLTYLWNSAYMTSKKLVSIAGQLREITALPSSCRRLCWIIDEERLGLTGPWVWMLCFKSCWAALNDPGEAFVGRSRFTARCTATLSSSSLGTAVVKQSRGHHSLLDPHTWPKFLGDCWRKRGTYGSLG